MQSVTNYLIRSYACIGVGTTLITGISNFSGLALSLYGDDIIDSCVKLTLVSGGSILAGIAWPIYFAANIMRTTRF